MNNHYSRRSFLRNTIGAGVAIAGTQMSCINAMTSNQKNPFDPKGLPTAVLGNTGVTIPRISIGLGSRWCSVGNQDEALQMLTYALDNGFYYWDTAYSYRNDKLGVVSEERIGQIVKNRRKEIFLSTKINVREPDEAKRQLDISLKRLQTDHVDILKVHAVVNMDDVSAIVKKGNVLDVITKAKEEGLTRFIGFSGHASAEALRALVDTGRFDTILFAMNHYTGTEDRQELVIQSALDKGMGVMLMKAVRPKETIDGIDINELVRFSLSLKGPHGVVVGMDSLKVVNSNLAILKNFKPMNDQEKIKYAMKLSPYFKHENLEWMKTGYRDGHWG